jgi:nicotinate-nucleotide pyrophosphorylase (carboxylating)
LKVDFISQQQFDTYLNRIITSSLEEDIGSGVHTSQSCIPAYSTLTARLLVKDIGIIAGIDLAEIIFHHLDPSLHLTKFFQDGDHVKKGDVAFTVHGNASSILISERTVLNFMQRLSGIATKSHHMQCIINSTGCKLLDTRKTTPGLRLLEKWAVSIGGAYNHRIGLYDMILIKDNHIDQNGSITQAVQRTKEYLQKNQLNLKIEVEIRTFDELHEALNIKGIDRLLLDNFNTTDLAKAVSIVNKQIPTEASGNITEENILEYALTGVNFISSGSLTNSVRSLDLSLKIIKQQQHFNQVPK